MILSSLATTKYYAIISTLHSDLSGQVCPQAHHSELERIPKLVLNFQVVTLEKLPNRRIDAEEWQKLTAIKVGITFVTLGCTSHLEQNFFCFRLVWIG